MRSPALEELRRSALEIFARGLAAADPREAIQRSVTLEGTTLRIFESQFDLATRQLYVVSIGKAALGMAAGLQAILGDQVEGGIIVGPFGDRHPVFLPADDFPDPPWQAFSGGHPLPTHGSLAAAWQTLQLLKRADQNRGVVIFLISGGGSAMIEWPRSDRITIDDLREANRILVSCGASIAEINLVRRAFSAVKGGGLADAAPGSDQVTLIVSDTNDGDEATVASGPSLESRDDNLPLEDVMDRYDLHSRLPQSIVETVTNSEKFKHPESRGIKAHYVLANNGTAINAAANRALELGYHVEIADDIIEQPIDAGCQLLLTRLTQLLESRTSDQTVCLISGGEFSCPVRGGGTGGRNLETVLRCAMQVAEHSNPVWRHLAVLSAGTDGIDGNSPAAGAIGDETSVDCAQALGLDPIRFLDDSDSFRFFQQLDSVVMTGPTGTNVRDLRILLVN